MWKGGRVREWGEVCMADFENAVVDRGIGSLAKTNKVGWKG